jgi:hypothetical protein
VLDSQSTTYATIWPSTSVVLAHMCHMNPTAIGTLMDNEFLDQVEEDLNDNSNEPATRGDVRNLALRVDLRFTKLESSIDQRFMAIDNRFTTFDESLKEYINKLGWRIFAATIGSAALMFVICGIYINSILK